MAEIGIILTEEEKRRILAPFLDPPPRRPAVVVKPKVVSLATKTELSVEAQRERVAREAAELVAAEKLTAEPEELREMDSFHRVQSSAHVEAAKWARAEGRRIREQQEADANRREPTAGGGLLHPRVVSVDREGRPKEVRGMDPSIPYDPTSTEPQDRWVTQEYKGGYSPSTRPGVQREYDPMKQWAKEMGDE